MCWRILRKARTQRKVSDSAPCILVRLSESEKVKLKKIVCCKKYCIFDLHFY